MAGRLLLGSISGSLLLGRWRGLDIRRHGSGNAGGTNALRVGGWRFALGVVVIDVGKGALATLLGAWSLDSWAVPLDQNWQMASCAFAAVLGHCWPVFFGFRGGKGAGTAIGCILVLSPWIAVAMILNLARAARVLAFRRTRHDAECACIAGTRPAFKTVRKRPAGQPARIRHGDRVAAAVYSSRQFPAHARRPGTPRASASPTVSIDPRDLLIALARKPVISGAALAAQFGVTRAAIWKQIETLRQLGVPICARAGAGYALSTPVDLLDAQAIQAALPRSTTSRLGRIDVRWQVDSTNSELLRGEYAADLQTLACFTEIQSAGRGRRGRAWQLPLGGGLAFSLRWRSESSMAALAGLSLAIGVGVVRALHDEGYDGIGLKWPNDLQWQDKKLGGILVELGGDALGPCHAVIGVGLNLRLDAITAARIDQPWTDLASIRANDLPDRNRLAARMLVRLIEVLDQFSVHAFAPFVNAFAQYDVLRGKPVCVHGGRGECEGIADGVDRHGALRMRTSRGDQVVDSGEVSVRPSSGGIA